MPCTTILLGDFKLYRNAMLALSACLRVPYGVKAQNKGDIGTPYKAKAQYALVT